MLSPTDLLEDGTLTRGDLAGNIHYLYDRKLIELVMGYNPLMFSAARLTPDGVDLVENPYLFNLRFPDGITGLEGGLEAVPLLVEQLVQEADFAAHDGENRRCLLRDVQYLRDELARPPHRWRHHVIATVLSWLEEYVKGPDTEMPSLVELKGALERARELD